jgi:uncharacterized protein YukE
MPPEALYTMHYGSMSNGIERMASACLTIDDRLDQLEAFSNENLFNWSDTAKDQYEKSRAAWNLAEENMNKLLQGKGITALEDIMQNTKTAEQTNESMWHLGY